MAERDDDVEVVKWYTRARKFPQLIGKTPDGATIWGGPYTYTQVIVAVVFIYVGIKTVGVWGPFDLIGNAVLLAAGTYGLVVVLGRAPIGSRNPLSVAAGGLRAVMSPPMGHYAGSPVRLRRPRRARSRLIITTVTFPALEAAAAPELADVRADDEVAPPTPDVEVVDESPRPALTGVQLLLAGGAR